MERVEVETTDFSLKDFLKLFCFDCFNLIFDTPQKDLIKLTR